MLNDLRAELECQLQDELGHLRLQSVAVGIFFTGVQLENGATGLCATPIKSIPEAVCCPSSAKALPFAGKLKGKPVRSVLQDLEHTAALRRTLALATFNALVETLWRRNGVPACGFREAGDIFAELDLQPADRVVVVGAFAPYLRELRKRDQDFRVLEKHPSTLKPGELRHYVPAEHAYRVIPWADVVIATGTTLLDGSLDQLLSWARPGSRIALVGPTVPLLPGPFIRRGVTLLCGVRVRQPQALLELLTEGASGYHLFDDLAQRITLRLA
ncbi:putative heavy-metal chelation [compost metagenome]|uniref:Uncharacterized conserved protein, contains DUF4213 and DUF364 domains n=1 Tax=Pseudomonas jinjuensis TaxID=198616 RepID=A0A1H0PRD1_9PSED|nr:DUF364 domain-containing protein [Pseudomonas jinjuensis]SDP07682.1 Uncharacterized conserved protein, contains DUF4213 and DUF364 domains [Pseudomonas jinjuensis]